MRQSKAARGLKRSGSLSCHRRRLTSPEMKRLLQEHDDVGVTVDEVFE